jgi:predicted phage replisome organizer
VAHQGKRYYWLKLKDDFFLDPRIKKLRKIAGGDTYTVIFLKLMLMTVNSDGVIVHEGIEKSLSDELALKLDEDNKNVEATLIFMQNMQLLKEINPQTFDIPQVRELTGSESQSASRVRQHRLNKKLEALQCNKDETPSNKNVTTEIRDKRKEKEPLSIVSLHNFDFFISSIRANYINQLIIEILDKHTNKPIAISVSKKGYLYNLRTSEDFQGSRAKELWQSMYKMAQEGKLNLIQREEKK